RRPGRRGRAGHAGRAGDPGGQRRPRRAGGGAQGRRDRSQPAAGPRDDRGTDAGAVPPGEGFLVPVRGRRPLGSPDARQAVQDAARELFSERGFERTTMRAVAARAGVDPALIYHYFGDKDGLLLAALQPPADAATALAGLAAAADRAGEELVRRLIGLWEDRPDVREQMVAILRTALSHDRASRLLRDILGSFILA